MTPQVTIKLYILAGLKKLIRTAFKAPLPIISKATYLSLNEVFKKYGEVIVNVESLWDSKMILNVTDVGLSHSLILRGIYEKDETEFLKQILHKGDIFVDVGSNFGYYTLLASVIVGKKGKVFSFEPDHYNFSILNRNSKINQRNNITCINKAVGEKSQRVNFYIDTDNYGRHNIIQNGRKDVSKVDLISLDNFFDKGFKIDVIKIDVEGVEEFVIKGMKKLINSNPSIKLLIEFFPERINQGYSNPLNLKRLIHTLGFSIYEISDSRLVKISFDDLYKKTRGRGELVNILLQKETRGKKRTLLK